MKNELNLEEEVSRGSMTLDALGRVQMIGLLRSPLDAEKIKPLA
jgi:hypothetical protein